MNIINHIITDPIIMLVMGYFTHIAFRLIASLNDAKQKNIAWTLKGFMIDNVAQLFIGATAACILCGVIVTYHKPIWTIYLTSLASSSIIMNAYPVITNPDMWNSVITGIINKVRGNNGV